MNKSNNSFFKCVLAVGGIELASFLREMQFDECP